MTSQSRPPVDEVALSVAFDDVKALAGPLLGMAVRDLFAEFPRSEMQSPYEIPLELPVEKQSLAQSGPRFEIVGVSEAAKPRTWLISDDDTELVQVQSDLYAFNWRRRKPHQVYPGYKHLRDKYRRLTEVLMAGLEPFDQADIKPRRAELAYVNILRPSEFWTGYRDVHNVVRLDLPDIQVYERLSLTYTKPIETSSGVFAGRLHVSLQPGVDIARQAQVVNLTFTARSATLDSATFDDAVSFFDLAHDSVTATFRSLITDRAREAWGLT